MKINIFLIYFLLSTPINLFSQEINKHTIMVEAGGSGFNSISINYLHRFVLQEGLSFNARIGAGPNIPTDHTYAVAAGSFTLGRSSSKLELGIGAMSTIPHFLMDNYLSGIIGYKYQSDSGPLMFRASFTPIFTPPGFDFMPWGGVSVGYSF